jgi:uncharacterized protein
VNRRRADCFRHFLVYGLVLILDAAPSSRLYGASSPGFDCGRAASSVEKAICASSSLSELDSQLTSFYHDALGRAQGPDRDALIGDERRWLSGRNKLCDSADLQSGESIQSCLEAAYRARIRELTPPDSSTDKAAALHVEPPRCTALPSDLNAEGVIAGFPGDLVPLFDKHPYQCGAKPGEACRQTSLARAGLHVRMGANCDGWVYVQSADTAGKLKGWIAGRRVNADGPSALPLPTASVHEPPKAPITPHPRVGLCQATRSILNGTRHFNDWPSHVLPDAKVPEEISSAAEGQPQVSEVILGGQHLKKVSFRGVASGMAFWDDMVTLWTEDFGQQITNKLDGNNDLTQSLVSVLGKPVFLEQTNSTGSTEVSLVTEKLTLQPICRLMPVEYEGKESVEYAPDRPVCDAAAKGRVESVVVSDIVPYSITGDALAESADERQDQIGEDFDIVATGSADIDNSGHKARIGWAMGEPVPRGNYPQDLHYEWPVELDDAGTLRGHAPINSQTLAAVGDQSIARLFRFDGKTYLETHWNAAATKHTHEIWMFNPNGKQLVCNFSTGQLTRYEVADEAH